MIRFKKDDLAMHIVFMIMGAGIGYLIGAYVKSIKEVKEEFEEVVAPVAAEDKVLPQQKNTRQDLALKAELVRLCSEYTVTPVQIELVNSGVITIDQLETKLAKDGGDKIIRNYDKPDLAVLVAASGVVDHNEITNIDVPPYRVFLNVPSADLYDQRFAVIFDPATGAFYQYVKAKMERINGGLFDKNDDVLDVVVTTFGDVDKVYVLDVEDRILYEVDEDPENQYLAHDPEESFEKKQKPVRRRKVEGD